MTEDVVVDGVFEKEGDAYADEHSSPPIDQPTGPGGITLPVLSAFRGRSCTVADLKALAVTEAREVVRWKLRQLSLTNRISAVDDEAVRNQLLDFAYNSGGSLAIRWFQRVLGVPRTGIMDAATVAAANAPQARAHVLLNQALVAARLQMVDMATDAAKAGRKGIDAKYEEGLENRALRFSALEVP